MGDANLGKDAYYTTLAGCPVKDPQATARIGGKLQGTLLIQDINLLEIISHATHERIPERLVHAKGTGARGVFECTSDDIRNYTDAAFLSAKGKKTDLRVRFSTVAGGRGSADTVRDTRGFAFKLYTEEGNLDWMFFSEPVFPIRDGGKFPSFVHCQKGMPSNNLFDPTTFWEFFNANAEAYHALLMIFTDRGTPQGYEFSEIFSLNTYKFTKTDVDGLPKFFYIKVHLKPTLGVKNFTRREAVAATAKDPDLLSRQLYDCIENNKKSATGAGLPQWDVFAQIMPPSDAENYHINIFDPTKVWSQKDYPLVPFGKITLNENPENYFQEVEQISFSPSAIVPGWDITPDPILQTRLFAYGSAARYRLGINFMQNMANRPKYSYNPTRRDGAGVVDNLGSLPNYIPGDLAQVTIVDKPYEAAAHEQWLGTATYFDSAVTDDDYVQPREFYEKTLSPDEQTSLQGNIGSSLLKTIDKVKAGTLEQLGKISPELAAGVAAWMKAHPKGDDDDKGMKKLAGQPTMHHLL